MRKGIDTLAFLVKEKTQNGYFNQCNKKYHDALKPNINVFVLFLFTIKMRLLFLFTFRCVLRIIYIHSSSPIKV